MGDADMLSDVIEIVIGQPFIQVDEDRTVYVTEKNGPSSGNGSYG
jgi:hypothetical protein